ncbi:hypothetical protein MSG28_000941 [Choristoneura fumiferana]|uniref:Uncharacterized protein n=1 Tax=Choristoneura fumiferana TaxID=7141 RepID=A0ACC0K343_CHOFU|nr:hypothetical protein MSG28_000941 [Choristoneura fumiferana]
MCNFATSIVGNPNHGHSPRPVARDALARDPKPLTSTKYRSGQPIPTLSKTCSHSHRFMLQLIYAAGFRTNLKEAFAVEKPRQAASSSSDKRKITKSKKYRDDSLSSPPSLPMKPIEEELNEIHAAMSKLVLNVAADSL